MLCLAPPGAANLQLEQSSKLMWVLEHHSTDLDSHWWHGASSSDYKASAANHSLGQCRLLMQLSENPAFFLRYGHTGRWKHVSARIYMLVSVYLEPLMVITKSFWCELSEAKSVHRTWLDGTSEPAQSEPWSEMMLRWSLLFSFLIIQGLVFVGRSVLCNKSNSQTIQ